MNVAETYLLCYRKKERPYYKKHRSTRPGGWNHLECKSCNDHKRQILKEPNNEEAKASFQAHLDRALGSRKIYWDTRAKAVRNEHKGYFSIIVDAGGGSGCTHLPRFRNTEKGMKKSNNFLINAILSLSTLDAGEPARHEMLKMKSTFVKMHGHGSLLVLTLPDYERQGGNLTVECILRSLWHILETKKLDFVKNLYIQLDNVGTNKCKTVFSCMILLVLLGVCKKIKLSFLEVGHTHEVRTFQ